MFRNLIAVTLGAIGGALSRYYLGLYFAKIFENFPFGTFFVNITGSFIMGLFVSLVAQKTFNFSPEVVLFVTTGFLGSYTSFSSYELDSIKLLDKGLNQIAVLYWLGSPILGFIGIKLGIFLANKIGDYP